MRLEFFLPLILLVCCKQVPLKKLSQWNQEIDYYVTGDSLYIQVENPISCPLRIFARSAIDSIQNKLDHDFPLILLPNADTLFSYPVEESEDEIRINFSTMMGNPNDEVFLEKLELPFVKGKKYKIIQGYNGKFSHSSEYSKFALDFELLEGDSICAAADGFVVGVIEEYQYGGNSKKWRDYANFITVFHPEMNVYTQYVHIMHMGSLVVVGDRVQSGQPIGLSGKTGFTSTEHLHFNVLAASENGVKSIPCEFKEGYKGIELKAGDFVEK
jgi:murein DD-endopeptidase MepM/ murein hydrolase activator NlpD